MRDMFDFQKRLFQFRKSEPIIHIGKTMHFITRDNTYAYFRYTDEGAVFVYLNASEENRTLPANNYKEILSKYNAQGIDILTDKQVEIKQGMVVSPLSAIVVKLNKK